MENTFNILAIDPGNNLGVSIMTINALDFSIVNIYSRTIILDSLVPDIHSDKMLYKLNALSSIVSDLIYNYSPLAVGIETAFLNSRFPKAVMQLSQYTAIIEMSINSINSFIKIFKYAPRYIKSNVGAGGNANKEDMLSNILTIGELMAHVDIKNMSEHEIDAIAIAYTTLKEIRNYPMIMYAV